MRKFITILLILFSSNLIAEEIYLDCDPIQRKGKTLDFFAPHELITINTKDKTFTSKKSKVPDRDYPDGRDYLIVEGTENEVFNLESNETYYGGFKEIVSETGTQAANYWLHRFTLEMGSKHEILGSRIKMTHDYNYQCELIDGI